MLIVPRLRNHELDHYSNFLKVLCTFVIVPSSSLSTTGSLNWFLESTHLMILFSYLRNLWLPFDDRKYKFFTMIQGLWKSGSSWPFKPPSYYVSYIQCTSNHTKYILSLTQPRIDVHLTMAGFPFFYVLTVFLCAWVAMSTFTPHFSIIHWVFIGWLPCARHCTKPWSLV